MKKKIIFMFIVTALTLGLFVILKSPWYMYAISIMGNVIFVIGYLIGKSKKRQSSAKNKEHRHVLWSLTKKHGRASNTIKGDTFDGIGEDDFHDDFGDAVSDDDDFHERWNGVPESDQSSSSNCDNSPSYDVSSSGDSGSSCGSDD